jgi:hypothetical protein
LTQAWNPTADSAVALLLHYIFDLGGHNARELVERWLRFYPANWVRLAAIEALYQGRYKAVSVEQILGIWQRRGQIQPHFNCEFERLVCGNIQPRLSGKQSHPFSPVIQSHPIAIAPITPKSNSHAARHALEAKTTEPASCVQPIDVSRYLKRAKVNTSHRQADAVAAVEIPDRATFTTAENREALERERRRDRYDSKLDSNLERRISPSSSLPRSNGSHHQPPIRQFNPGTTKTSDFYTKLKAMSQHS